MSMECDMEKKPKRGMKRTKQLCDQIVWNVCKYIYVVARSRDELMSQLNQLTPFLKCTDSTVQCS